MRTIRRTGAGSKGARRKISHLPDRRSRGTAPTPALAPARRASSSDQAGGGMRLRRVADGFVIGGVTLGILAAVG
ncbi:MAG: hypothetical protein ACREON_13605, partial [Gemmatimonadaceae bacterium]